MIYVFGKLLVWPKTVAIMSFVTKGRPLRKKDFVFPFACVVTSGFCFYQNYNKRQNNPNRLFWTEFEKEQIGKKKNQRLVTH